MRHSDLVERCLAAAIAGIVVGMVLVGIAITWSNWSECRNACFSVQYCIKQIS